ncbi:MAG: hypothetical protein K5755_04160 [Clostridiales bacterium]|nr:hypothetical protein [Clostridiales bacterium]
MSENKDLNAPVDENLDETVASVGEEVEQLPEEAAADSAETAESITEDVSEDGDLDKELEEIRDYFQQELDKAKAQAEDSENEAEETADEEKKTDEEAEEEVNENLCLCCGEREKMEGSDYCEDCHEAMRRYPFKWVYFLVALLAVYVAVLAVGKIADINAGWVYAYEGDVLAEAGWYNDALDKYEYAQNYLYRSKVEPKMIYLRNLEVGYEQGGFNVINAYPMSVATLFEEWELKLPHMKRLKQYYMTAQEMKATIQTVNEEIFSEYSSTPAEELPYDEIIKKISSLENKVLHIGIDEDGNEIADEPTTEKAGEMSSSNAVYFKRTTKYNTAMLQYFKYYFATTCNKSFDEKIGFLEAVKANAPEMTWLYAGEMGIEYAENGDKDKALEYADIIYKNSETDVTSYYIRSLVAKKIDNDYDKAIEYCEQGNGYSVNYELYRQIALNYLLKGDYEKAQENAESAYGENQDLSTINALAFCALANKDETKFKEMEQLFTDYNAELEDENDALDFSQSVLDLKSGKKTVAEILEQGGYDLYD